MTPLYEALAMPHNYVCVLVDVYWTGAV